METHLQQPSHPPKKKWPKSHPNPSGLLLILKGLSHHEIRPSSDATPKFLPQHAWNAVAQSREARIFLFKDTVHLCRNWWEALGTFIWGMTKLHCSSHFCLCKLPGQDTSIGRPLDHLHFLHLGYQGLYMALPSCVSYTVPPVADHPSRRPTSFNSQLVSSSLQARTSLDASSKSMSACFSLLSTPK